MAKACIDTAAVLQTAILIADKKGLSYVTLKEVAQRLRIKTPSLYNHVEGIEHLNSLLAVYGLKCLRAEIAEAAIGLSGNKAIHAIANAYMGFARKHPGLYEATQRPGIWQDKDAEQTSNDIIHLVEKVMAEFPLAKKDMTHIIRMFRSVLHGFASLLKNKGFAKPIRADESFCFAIEFMLQGIHAKHPPEQASRERPRSPTS
ncbi:MAG: WHG domain-containing protein [Cystobacterineae bacterium]|nr:WHG domain-containing protein [Cystobacterineae bacterium]